MLHKTPPEHPTSTQPSQLLPIEQDESSKPREWKQASPAFLGRTKVALDTLDVLITEKTLMFQICFNASILRTKHVQHSKHAVFSVAELKLAKFKIENLRVERERTYLTLSIAATFSSSHAKFDIEAKTFRTTGL